MQKFEGRDIETELQDFEELSARQTIFPSEVAWLCRLVRHLNLAGGIKPPGRPRRRSQESQKGQKSGL